MDPFLLTAAVLTFCIGLLHSILGEKFILTPLFLLDLPLLRGRENVMEWTIRFAWHLTTVLFWGIAAVFILLACRHNMQDVNGLVHILAITFFISALLSFVITRARHFSWWVFLIIAVMVWLSIVERN